MNLRKINDEVFVADESIVQIGKDEVAFVKRQALSARRKRARICAHRSNEDLLHEMVIAISAGSYIHPHKHLEKVESFHIIEGEVDVVVFDDEGRVVELMELGNPATGKSFFYRMSESYFHTLLIKTDFLVVHEVTNGPFLRDRTVLAPFAPPEDEADRAMEYLNRVAEQAQYFRRRSQSRN